MTFSNMEVCVDGNTSFVELGLLTVDMNETTPVSPDVAETKVTPDPGLTETRPSAAPVFTSTHHSKGPDGATGAAEHAITGRNFSSSEVETIEKTKTVKDCLCNDGKGLRKDEQLLDIALRPPAAECDPKIIMTFPTVEACVDVEDFLAAVSPPPASVKQDPAAPTSLFGCCSKYSTQQIYAWKIKRYSLQTRDSGCDIDAYIFETYDGRLTCADPEDEWEDAHVSAAAEFPVKSDSNLQKENMQRFVQITVALLNVIWIVLFLTFDLSHVLIQRRSLNEEEAIEEFCVQPPGVKVSTKESNKANTVEGTKLSNLMSSAAGGGDETNAIDDKETARSPPVPDLTTTETTSAKSSEAPRNFKTWIHPRSPFDMREPPALDLISSKTSSPESPEAFPPEETHKSDKEKDALNLSPASYVVPLLLPPHCCKRSYSLIPAHFRKLIKRREYQGPPECPVKAVVMFTSSGERFCASFDALWTDKDEETATFYPTVIPQSTEDEFYDYNEEDFS
ncbi:uncharacterized protein LOC117807597 [Xyrichtys novacula]|uniref:Uncharacterized protein LOC117807597 n=1 Tax=Xyrichtys novacula TaxID=13765 RepID=A0AAV1HKW7_XYRNO|nr:uncharacterized protein LOC117807597 [Xyrichtys novacula]